MDSWESGMGLMKESGNGLVEIWEWGIGMTLQHSTLNSSPLQHPLLWRKKPVRTNLGSRLASEIVRSKAVKKRRLPMQQASYM